MKPHFDFNTTEEKGIFIDLLNRAEKLDFNPLASRIYLRKVPFYRDGYVGDVIDNSKKKHRVH